MEAMEELAQLSESIRQAASLLADDDPSDDSAPRRPSTFLNAVVLGNVGAGKSAVLNSLIGHPVLPTGENGATRAPIVVDLQREPGLSTKTIMLQIDSKSQQVSSSGLRRSLQEKLSKAATGRGRAEEISLRMRTSTAPSLKLVDLPGLDQRVVDDSMINDYAGHNDAILLVVIPAAQAAEVASSRALRLARDIDSDGSRTIGVLSKVDQAAGDEKTIACVQALLSNKGPKNLPDIEWVALIGQSVAIASAQSGSVVSENSLEAACQAEAESLKSIFTGAPSSKLGRISLVDTIAKQIRKRMKVRVPNLLTGGDMKAKARSLSVKRGGVEKSTSRPKRPINGYFFFMEGYRKDYKEMHPHVKKLATISRAGSKVWKSMTKAEKAPYKAKAEKLSVEYTKKMDAYKKSQPPCVTKAKKRKATYTNKSKSERDEEDDSGNSSLSAKKSKVEKGPKKPKRPVNNFFLFIEDFKNDYKEKYPDTKRECNLRKAGAKVWKSLPADKKAPYTAKAKKLMDEYKKIRAYNNQQEAQRRPATLDKSKSKSDMQAGGREVPGGSDKTLDKSKSKSDMQAGGQEVPGDSDKTLDKSKSKSDMQAGGREVPGGSDKSESESDLDTGGSEASGGSDKYKSESLQAGGPEAPGGSDKSKPKSDLKGGGLEAPGGSDKSKPKSDLKGGGPEAPGGSDKSKPKSDLKGGGPEAPGGSDKSKPKSDLKGGGLVAPDNSKAENDNEDHDSGANSGNSKPESVRPLHPKEATVLGRNEGKPRRQRFPGGRLFCGLKMKITGRSMKPRASS